jgi:predicted MFS family arabinose efflux permease
MSSREHGTLIAAMAATVGAAALIVSAAMGIRQTFGLFIAPLALERGLPVTRIAFAVALHNLVWGIAQPFAGAAADRYGAGPVVAFGALTFAAGLTLAALAPGGVALTVGLGLLVGIGIGCTGFGVVMTTVGKVASPETRSMAMGLVSAGGSLGQVLMVPLAQGVTARWGMTPALMALAVVIVAVAPLGFPLDRPGRGRGAAPAVGGVAVGEALTVALGHSGYRLLTVGFFACGFQLAFIATHLPGYLSLCHMPVGLGATALALIGLFNMAGSWACGWMGGRFRQHHVLGWLYLIRGAAIAAFALLPPSDLLVILFAAVMGLTWLGTVPLTSGLVARMFGVGHLGALFGVCFLSHQIGSFLGAWVGGLMLDLTGSYSAVWMATAIAGLVAALLHFAIDDDVHGTDARRPAIMPAGIGPAEA